MWGGLVSLTNIPKTIDYRDYMDGIENGLISQNTPPYTGHNTSVHRGHEGAIRAAVSTLFQLYDEDSHLFSTSMSCKA